LEEKKLVSSILLSLFILWKQQAHKSTCIMGGGDSRGADNFVDIGTRTIDDDPVAMYLGYTDV
jgi:hypothetical protein